MSGWEVTDLRKRLGRGVSQVVAEVVRLLAVRGLVVLGQVMEVIRKKKFEMKSEDEDVVEMVWEEADFKTKLITILKDQVKCWEETRAAVFSL